MENTYIEVLHHGKDDTDDTTWDIVIQGRAMEYPTQQTMLYSTASRNGVPQPAWMKEIGVQCRG